MKKLQAVGNAGPVANSEWLTNLMYNPQGGEVVLPAGEIVVQAQPLQDKRYCINIKKDAIIRSEGNTVIKLVGDQYAKGFDNWNYELGLIKIEESVRNLEIMPNITLVVEGYDPLEYPKSNLDPEHGFAPPRAVLVAPCTENNIRRTIVWNNPVLRGPWNSGIEIFQDALYLVGCQTNVRLNDVDMEVAGVGIAAWGGNKSLDINGCKILFGTHYPNGNGYGEGGYNHQGCRLRLQNFEIIDRFGRECWKDAGTSATGGSGYSFIDNGVFKSLRPGFGRGLGIDKWRNLRVMRVRFDSSLYGAVGAMGGFEMEDCDINCKQFISTQGQGYSPYDDRQKTNINHCKFNGCEEIGPGGVQFCDYSFKDCLFSEVTNPLAVPFQFSDPWGKTCSFNMQDCEIKEYNTQQIFNFYTGRWFIKNTNIEAETMRGIFGMGAENDAYVKIKGGTRIGNLWYHSIPPENIARIEFEE